MNGPWIDRGRMITREGTMSAAAGVVAGVQGFLILRSGLQVVVPGSRVLSRPFSSSGSSSNTSCCASRPLCLRTDVNESRTGIPCMRRKLGRGSTTSSSTDTLRRTQQKNHRHAMAHIQDGCFLTFKIDGGHEIGTRRAVVLVGAEGKAVY